MRVASTFPLARPIAVSLFLLFPIASGAQAPEAKPAASAPAATPATYEVKRGDTLYAIARRLHPEGITLNQTVVALFRANPEAFTDGNINLIRVGVLLVVPLRDAMASLAPADATREALVLIAGKPGAVVASVAPEAAPTPSRPVVPERVPGAKLGHEVREARYREGLAAEARGDQGAAFQAYLAAGEAGHGLAQKKLGEIYDRGTAAVQRDYGTALQWYQKAREQGVAIPRAETRPGPVLR